jgi:hypothetical protein
MSFPTCSLPALAERLVSCTAVYTHSRLFQGRSTTTPCPHVGMIQIHQGHVQLDECALQTPRQAQQIRPHLHQQPQQAGV